jgi:hypothetical protein
MKKIIDFLISFALFITINYITEDWSTCTKLGKIYYYPFWFIRSMIYWIVCPIFLPEYFFKQSKFYQNFKKLQKSHLR